METYLIEQVKIKESKPDKRGKEYNGVGIFIKGVWYNSTIYNKQDLALLKQGASLNLILYTEQGTGDYAGRTFSKFKFPTETDKLKIRVDHLEQGLKKLYDNINIKAFLDAEEL